MQKKYKIPEIPADENLRLEALYSYQLLDDFQKKEFDEIAQLAASICNTPISLITLVDSSVQWHKGRFGDIGESVDRDVSFCAHAILEPYQLFVVEDTSQDDRFKENPLVVSDPNIAFYAGMPLVTKEGFPLGAICVIDEKSRTLNKHQIKALKTLSKQVIRLFELHRTVQEMQEKEALLEQNIKNLEEYASFIAHDLRNPFRNIEVIAQLLIDKNSDLNSDSVGYLNDIITEAQESREFIINLLKYSKSIHSFNHDAELVDMNMLIQRIIQKITSPEHFSIVIDEELPQIYQPRVALLHVFGNLIENAVKYTENNEPKITIRYEEEDDDYIFYITDNGNGIEPKLLIIVKKLLDDRLESDGKFIKSIGLGLVIVKKLIDLMGGSISVQSILGNGTEFTIQLPQNASI